MSKKWSFVTSLVLLLTLVFGGSVFAFSDVGDEPEKDKILSLKKEGIISGMNDKTFAPKSSLTNAQAIQFIVKGMGLNIDHLRFIKEPKASDIYTNIPDNAWYAPAFIIAHYNGLGIPKDVNPNAHMTREQFAQYLFKAISTKGDFAFIEIWIQIADEKDINKDYMESIQKLLIAKVAKLDKDQKFHPKKVITRAAAAIMLHDARQFVEKMKPIDVVEPGPGDKPEDCNVSLDEKVNVTTQKATDDVNKVTVAWGCKPNPGYSVSIDRIDFKDNEEAVVYYTLHYPKKGVIYTQQIVYPKAETFVGSNYKVIVKNTESSSKDSNASDDSSQASGQ